MYVCKYSFGDEIHEHVSAKRWYLTSMFSRYSMFCSLSMILLNWGNFYTYNLYLCDRAFLSIDPVYSSEEAVDRCFLMSDLS